MLFLKNLNNLFKCNLNANNCSLNLQRYLSAKTYFTGLDRRFDAQNSRTIKSLPQLKIHQNVHRFMSTISNNGTDNTKAPKYFTDDSNPNEVSIYQGKITKQILRVKMFSWTTSMMGLLAQPVLWHKGLEVSGTGLSVFLCSVAGFFTLTPMLLHFVTKKYVIDIKYNETTDEYTCVTISFFMFKREIKFKVEDIHLPEIETMFTSMKIGPKKIPVFVDVASFNDTHHYARFMGYDKPLEFRLDGNESVKTEHVNMSSDKIKSTQSIEK